MFQGVNNMLDAVVIFKDSLEAARQLIKEERTGPNGSRRVGTCLRNIVTAIKCPVSSSRQDEWVSDERLIRDQS